MNSTLRYSLIYGGLSGLVLGAFILALGLYHDKTSFVASLAFGYSVMLVAMSFIFVGVKRYRDVEGGGVIRFWRAWALGLLTTLVGGLIYVLAWEVYLAATQYEFVHKMIASELARHRAEGLNGAALAKKMEFANSYANPLVRMPMTFIEIAPVGFLVALVSAALLRFSRFLPARR